MVNQLICSFRGAMPWRAGETCKMFFANEALTGGHWYQGTCVEQVATPTPPRVYWQGCRTRVSGTGLRVKSVGSRVKDQGSGSRFRGLGFRVKGLCVRINDVECRARVLGGHWYQGTCVEHVASPTPPACLLARV